MSARERKKDNNNIIDRSGDTKKKERGKRVREKKERERYRGGKANNIISN